jgi:hypothetical protein
MTLEATWVFEHGEEDAPDSPTGLKRLELAPDGRFRFENRRLGRLIAERTGKVAAAATEEIAGDLAAAGFPAVPDHPRPPGANYLTIASGDASATLSVSGAKNLPGYGPLVRRLVPWLRYLVDRQGDPPRGLTVDG